MKQLVKLGAVALVASVMMSSCYSSKVYVGNTTPETSVVKVQSKKNHILLWGLLPLSSSEQIASKYVDGKKDYKIKTDASFVDGLLNCLTLGIYTPTTTSYFVPVKDLK